MNAAQQTDILRIQPDGIGAAYVTLRLPPDAMEPSGWAYETVKVVVADRNGALARAGKLWTMPLSVAAGIALFCTVLLYSILGVAMAVYSKRMRSDSGWNVVYGLFSGRDNVPSLSLFQVLLWTLVTFWALLFVLLRTWSPVVLTIQIMALLGFAGVSSVASRWITSTRNPGGSAPVEAGIVKSFTAMLMTDDRPDLLKIQLFSFTVFAVGYVLVRVAQDSAFPTLDENLLLLMGVSNLTYLGGKLAEATPAERAQVLKTAHDAAVQRLEYLKARFTEAEKTKLHELEKEKRNKTSELTTEKNAAKREALNKRVGEIEEEIGPLAALSRDLKAAEADLTGINDGLKKIQVDPAKS
jgi:hypothetical protein